MDGKTWLAGNTAIVIAIIIITTTITIVFVAFIAINQLDHVQREL